MRFVQREPVLPPDMPLELSAAVAWHMALVPVLWMTLFRRDAHRGQWLCAFAFAVSWFVDFAGSIAPHWWDAVHMLPAFQLTLFAVAMGATPFFALFMAGLVFSQMPWLVVAMGSFVTLACSGGKREEPVMWWYCGLGSVLYLFLVANAGDTEVFMAIWWPYQLTRLVAIVWFIALLHPRRKEALA